MDVVEELTKMYESKYDDLVRMYKSRAGANDVEDVLQEAFYRALYYKNSYNPQLVKLENWFVSILNNCLKDLYKEKRNGSSMHDTLTPESALIEPRLGEGLTKVVLSELGKKKGDHKSTLYLYFICGYDLQEIQETLSIPYLTINSSVVRFKNQLRAAYPEYKDDCI